MYGKLPERKIKESDYVLSCEEVRRQLDAQKDTENRRVNIDSAKKLAVVQRMDYEGFRQMVLGAHIFPAKSMELSELMKRQEGHQDVIKNKIFDEKKTEETFYALNKRVQGNSEKHCSSFRDFKKKFAKNYDKQLSWEKSEECYSLIKEQNQTRLEKIFNLECEADILIKIVEVFKFIMQFLKSNEKKDESRIECGFMVKFLQMVMSIPTMQDISMNILTKKQRERVALFLEDCKIILSSEEEEAVIGKVIGLIKK